MDRKYKYNLKKDKEDINDSLFKNHKDYTKGILPPKSVDLRPKMPPMWDQGNLGSCQSHAIDAIVSYIHGNSFDPSRLFTYYNVRMLENDINDDCGGDLRTTCKAVAKYGVCPTSDCPYDIANFTVKPSDIAYKDALSDEIYSYYRLNMLLEMELALAAGHLIMIGIEVYESFESDECINTGIIPAPSGEQLGGHAVVICGYNKGVNNDDSYFIIRNSWGTGVGLNGTGYFQISYTNLKAMLMDAWTVIK